LVDKIFHSGESGLEPKVCDNLSEGDHQHADSRVASQNEAITYPPPVSFGTSLVLHIVSSLIHPDPFQSMAVLISVPMQVIGLSSFTAATAEPVISVQHGIVSVPVRAWVPTLHDRQTH
jgi:hypothetical protein